MPAYRHVRILGTGKFLPSRTVPGEELDERLGLPLGTVAAKSGVKTRQWVDGETATGMGAAAARMALKNAGLELSDLDAVICGNAVGEQLIPCNAALLHRELGLSKAAIPAFDVNSTCLSFVTALDVASHMIEAGQFERVLLVSSEIASIGVDFEHIESASLFGDGAAAAVVGKAAPESGSVIFGSRMETYSDAADTCRLVGGGTGLFATEITEENRREYLFHMDGPAVFKAALLTIPGFMERLLTELDVPMPSIDLIVPHQASRTALELIRRKLDVPPAKWMNILEDHGNCISASIPMALHEAITSGRLKRGQRALLTGTSAGLSIGGLILRY